MKQFTAQAYTVAWLCASSLSELVVATAMLDEEHDRLSIQTYDDNSYTYGSINGHNIVIAHMPPGQPGKVFASKLVQPLSQSFPNLKIHLFVGIGGGVPRIPPPDNPEDDIHLGDVVIGWAEQTGVPGVVQWDFVRYMEDRKTEPLGTLDKPDRRILNALGLVLRNRKLKRTKFAEHFERLQNLEDFSHPGLEHDRLFKSTYHHVGKPNCSSCDRAQLTERLPRVNKNIIFHQGTIVSGDTIMEDPQRRDEISQIYHGALCFEMEAAGVMNDKHCLIICGIADYADSHKNDLWQNYAAGTAAVFARELLFTIQPQVVDGMESQARNKPKPSSTVPFHQDSMFVGREDIITNIHNKLEQAASQSHSRVALVGLGGVGKSQIAIEYAYRLRKSKSHIWVFWIHASNAVRFEQAYRDIATKVELPGRDDPKADILRLVYDWLCDEKNGQWLMILDSADDQDVFLCSDSDLRATGQASLASSRKTPLLSFLPQSPNGWILVTSRNSLAAINLVGMQHELIQVEPMNEEDALALLQTRFSINGSSKPEARALVQALECIPLAVTQAAAYIRARDSPRITVSTYLQQFCESEENQAHLLKNEEAGDLRRDSSIPHAVITTWQISFEQIRRTKPEATDLLALMSMFDRQGIPEHLLHDSTVNRLQFDDAVAPLISFSLVRMQTGPQVEQQLFEMHRLVQLSTRKWLELNQQLEKWMKQSLQNLAVTFPDGQYETWAACQVLLPHSKMVLSYLSNNEDENEMLNRATVAKKMSQYLDHRGDYAAAEKLGRVGLEGHEKVLGPEHRDTLASVSNLGSVLENLGKYEESEAMCRRALEASEKVLGREHPSTLACVNNLGSVLGKLGKYEESEAMYRRGFEASEKVLGREHPSTLGSVNNLGLVLWKLGKYEEAEAMLRQGSEAMEKVLGREHPSTLASVNNLGLVLGDLGRYEEAEAMHRRGLEAEEEVLGREHPNTLLRVNSLGAVLWKLGKYEEAEAMHRRCLEATEKLLGREHPSTLLSLNNLGAVLWKLGKYEEAEAMLRRGSEAMEKVLGREHPSTLGSVNNLGEVLVDLGKYEESEAMHRRGLEASEKVLRREHPSTLAGVSNLGLVLGKLGKYEESEAMHRRGLEASEKVLGREHPRTLLSVNNLGLVLGRLGKYEESEAMHRRCLEATEKLLGREHPSTLLSLNNLGAVLWDLGKYEEAEAMLRRGSEAREKVLGREHAYTLTSVHNLAYVLHKQKHYDNASALYHRASSGLRKVLGTSHPISIACDRNWDAMKREMKQDECD